MTGTQRSLLTFGALVPLPIMIALVLTAVYGNFDGRPDGALEASLFVVYWSLLAVAVGTWIWSLILIRRSPRLSDHERTRWTWLVLFGTVFALPALWWRFGRLSRRL